MRAIWTVLLAVSFSFGVGGASVLADIPPEKTKEEPKKEEPKDDKLDLPWTVEEIKKNVKKGMTLLFKLEQTLGEKTTTTYTKMEVTAVTDEGYTSKTTTLDAEKKEVGKAKEKTEKWSAYMAKMGFKKSDTTVAEESIEVPAGKFDCKVYTQKVTQNGVEMTRKFYFPKDKAGTLVKVTGEGGGIKVMQQLEEMSSGEETK